MSVFNDDPGLINVSDYSSVSGGSLAAWLAGTATFGSGTVIDATNGCGNTGSDTTATYKPSLAALSSSSFAICYRATGSAIHRVAVGLVDSALNVTLGTALTPTLTGTPGIGLVRAVSSSKIISILNSQTDSQAKLFTHTLSGSSLTLDASSSAINNESSFLRQSPQLVMLSATRGVLVYRENAGGRIIHGFTIGTGSITLDGTSITTVETASVNSYTECLIKLSSTTALFIYDTGAGTLKAVVITDGGSSLSKGTAVSICPSYSNETGIINAAYDPTSGLVMISIVPRAASTGPALVFAIGVSGTTVTASAASLPSWNTNCPNGVSDLSFASVINGIPQFVAVANGSYGTGADPRVGIQGYEVSAIDEVFAGKFKSSGDTSYAPTGATFSGLCMLSSTVGVLTSGTGTTAKLFAFRL